MATVLCGRRRERPRSEPWWPQPALKPARATSVPCSAQSVPEHRRSPTHPLGNYPTPIPHKGKAPIGEGWQLRVITEETAPQFFNGAAQNIGVVLGPTSSGLTDVDLDSPEAIAAAPYLLPQTQAIFGRPGKKSSHYLFRTALADTATKAVHKFGDPVKKDTLVELRVGGESGAQTVFPGSVHKTGEPIDWEKNGEPAETDGEALLKRVQAIAAASLLVRYWPADGSGHDAALALGSVLGGAGWSDEDIKKFVRTVAHAAGDPEILDRAKAASDSAIARKRGEKAYGIPKLKELVGDQVAQ